MPSCIYTVLFCYIYFIYYCIPLVRLNIYVSKIVFILYLTLKQLQFVAVLIKIFHFRKKANAFSILNNQINLFAIL